MDVINAPASGDADIDALVEGPIWAGTTLTYSFPTQAQFIGYTGGEPYNNFQVFNATQTAAARAAFNMIASFTGLTFQQVTGTDAGTATIRFGMSDDPDTAYAYLPNSDPMGGDAWFNNSSGDYDDPVRGNYAWDTIMHEIGHTLGLGHPHEADPPMEVEHDWLAYTVMSYRSHIYGSTDGYTNPDGSFPQTYMIEDIAALQFLYGANFNFRGGNTTYTWSPTTGEMFVNGTGQGAPCSNTILMTIWDGGGNDTFDFSNYSGGIEVDLEPGHFTNLSVQLPDLGDPYGRPGNIATALLYHGDQRSLIENAIGTSGDDSIGGNEAANHLIGGGGADQLSGQAGNDFLEGNDGGDTLFGGNGDDTLVGGGVGGGDRLFGDYGNDTLIAENDGGDFLDGGDGNDSLTGGEGFDDLHGGSGDDTINGGGSRDFVRGEDGADHLDGGDGGDYMEGGAGNDTLIGGAGNDEMYGGDGDNYMAGGAGDDFYLSLSANDQIVEFASEGNDTVTVSYSYVLPSTIENANLSALSGDATLTGNELDNVLKSSSMEDAVIDGGPGADTMSGGNGDDIFYVDNIGDIVYNVATSTGVTDGIDTIYSSVSYDLLADEHPDSDYYIPGTENLILTGSTDLNGIGNSLNNDLRGNSGANVLDGREGNDTLDGGAGADTMYGGAGNDTYYVDSAADTVSETGGGGKDTVHASVNFTLGAGVENLILEGTAALKGTGNGSANAITGNGGANTLEGGSGKDQLNGGNGNDVLNGGAGDDVLSGGAGADTASYAGLGGPVTVSLAVATAQDTGSGGVDMLSSLENLVGTNFGDTLTGNGGANRLDGGAGVDRMAGGTGNDTYFVDGANDVVTEYANEGTDTVNASDSYRLGANVENLVLDGTAALNGTGNGSANVLTGNSGANVLTGNGGNDALTGGLGNDTLNGGVGDDVLSGGGGADTAVYVGLPGGVAVSLALTGAQDTGAGGVDTLSGIENLTGTGYADTLTGNGAANTLDGGGAADTLTGGAGNDTYWVNLMADVVVEQAGQGTDTVHAAGNYALSDNVENLILEGNLNLSGTGNALANRLTGNSGNNVLDGLAGADWMAGGLGNDTYRVDNAGDVVVERSGGGTDTVLASASFTLAGETENLTLTGAAAIAGTGNGYANTLTGNAAANALSGMGGADTLNGGGGGDTLDGGNGDDVLNGGAWRDFLTGGYGADSFVFNLASDTGISQRDSIEDFSHAQHDLIDLSAIDAIAGGADDGFTVTDTFHHIAGELAVSLLATGHYLVRGDTNGDGLADFGIDVYSATALTSADFVL